MKENAELCSDNHLSNYTETIIIIILLRQIIVKYFGAWINFCTFYIVCTCILYALGSKPVFTDIL